jgi:tight adherence protein B
VALLVIFVVLGACAAIGIIVATVALQRPEVAAAGVATPWVGPVPVTDSSLRGQIARPFESIAARISERGQKKGNPGLGEQLLRADLKLRTGEFVMIQLALLLIFALLGFLRFGFGPQFVTAGVAGYLLPMRYVNYRQRKRLRLFNNQLADTLTLLASAMKAGYSFPQAIDSVSKNIAPPMADEMSRVVREMNVGRSPEQALAATLKRMPSDDFDLILTAVTIHSQVGGNLSRVFDNVAQTIRERVKVKGQIRTLTAQARLSGWIITLLPVALALFMYVITPSYFKPMVDEALGWAMLILAAIAIALGNLIIRRIVAIRV